MRLLASTLYLFTSLASPAFAGEISFHQPIDCTLGDTCYIQNYVDIDQGDAFADFTCGALSYDEHKGTDFAVPTLKDMWRGVDVLAAAQGTVRGTRNHMADHLQGVDGAPDITGAECGNGLVLDHGAGWTTQYCHMMQGSLRVKTGDTIAAGTVLGRVGISGHTQFPHVHITIRHHGNVVDPFNPNDTKTCEIRQTDSLWADPIEYQSTGLLQVGIIQNSFDYATIKNGTAHMGTLTVDAAQMSVYGFAFGGKSGDIMRLSLAGPQGPIAKYDVAVQKNQALYARSVGKKSLKPWPIGQYTATARLLRDGVILDEKIEHSIVVP